MIQKIKKDRDVKINNLHKEVQLFWAFSDDQFKKGLKENGISETEKIVTIGAGGYLPKKNTDKYLKGTKKINNEYITEMKKHKKEIITFEIRNYECGYTGDLTDVIECLEGIATPKEIQEIFNGMDFSNI